MPQPIPQGASVSPSTARNRGPILEVLKPHLPDSGLVLEIAAGAGEHAVYFAAARPDLRWQATDPDPKALASIAAWRDHVALPNLAPPLRLCIIVRSAPAMNAGLPEVTTTPLTAGSAMAAAVAALYSAIESAESTFMLRPGMSQVRIRMPSLSVSTWILVMTVVPSLRAPSREPWWLATLRAG